MSHIEECIETMTTHVNTRVQQKMWLKPTRINNL